MPLDFDRVSVSSTFHFDATENAEYIWDPDTRQSSWRLALELQRPGTVVSRVLGFVADEGSTGWSLFQFCANYLQMRIAFVRDPLHRLSNAYSRGLNGVRGVLRVTQDIVILHMWRRAP